LLYGIIIQMPKKTYTNVNKTGCCPAPDVKGWDNSKVVWKNKKFVKDHTVNLFHIPLNMGPMMKRITKKIRDAGAIPPTENFVMLSYDPSLWRTEHYLSVTKKVEGVKNITLSGTFLTKVFEGPYRDAGKWYKTMEDYVKAKDMTPKKIYFFYTTCPKCAKVYGKNYCIAFAQV